MTKQTKKLVLEEATLMDVNKHLRINLFAMVVLTLLLFLNTAQFLKDYSLIYGALIAIMVILLFVLAKARSLLKMRKLELTK